MKPEFDMKINKKIIIMNLIILVLIGFCVLYVSQVGDEYAVHIGGIYNINKPENVSVEFSNSGVVEYVDHNVTDQGLIVNFRSVKAGDTEFTVKFTNTDPDTGEESFLTNLGSFHVGFMGIIFYNYNAFNFSGYQVVIITLLAVLAIVEFFMIWMFADYHKRGNFCYPMIACGGMAIFIFILLLFGVYKIFNNVVNTFGHFIGVVSEIGSILLVALSPFMLILAVLLAVSNIWLIRHEGFRPVNTLGIIFAVLWASGTVFTLFPLAFTPLYRIVTYTICYFECMFIATVTASYLAAKYKPPFDRDYIIILGCAIRSDGTPTPLLKARADSALDFELEQFDKTGKHAVFVPSGGQGEDEVVSESESMANYLVSRGVDPARILREDKSVNTMQNMQFSKEVIERDCGDIKDKKIAFATTNYHVFRGYILAKKNGFEAKGISAKTKFYFFPNAFLREFIGLLVDQKFKHLIYIAIVLLLFLTVFR